MRLGLEAGEQTIELAVELGVTGVPISAEKLVSDGVEQTLAPLREAGLRVCQIGAFGYNPLSTNRERQAQQAGLLERAIPLASATGCNYIVISPGNYHPSGFLAADARNFDDEALDVFADALRPVLDLAEDHGVKLTIEAYLKAAINSPERFLALKERVDSDALVVNIDPTSLYNYEDMLDPIEKVHHVCTALAGHYGLVHVKEFALAEKIHIHVDLAPLGQGPTDWAQMLRLVAPHVPEDSWVILEHVLSPDEARSSVAYLRAAAQEAGLQLA